MFWCASVRKRREVISILGAGFVLLFFFPHVVALKTLFLIKNYLPGPYQLTQRVTYCPPESRAQKAEPDLSETSPAPLCDPFMRQGRSARVGSVKAVCLKRAQADLAYPRFTSFVHIFRAGNWIFLAAGYDREIQGCLGKLYVVGADGDADFMEETSLAFLVDS